MFIDDLFKNFNLILLICCTILIFINNQLNGMNITILLLNFDRILEISINICVSSFGVCVNVGFSVSNIT